MHESDPQQPATSGNSRRGLRRTGAKAGPAAYAAFRAIRIARLAVRRAIEALLALIILFEEWGWRPLAAALAALARFAPVARVEAMVASLPPYAALVVFAAPSALLLPLKLLSLWLIGNGQVVLASALFIGAKVVGTALVARIFQLTQPALMRLTWFARLYGIVIPWKEALVERVRQSWVWQRARLLKMRLKERLRFVWEPARAAARALAARLRGLFARRS
ncbi:MAG TPA: hypothetical protein VFV47_10045 [Hyphomicrobiaceae bacterium]|nr:hypothetical protein [Hyphomicrobiaceae bacterium]